MIDTLLGSLLLLVFAWLMPSLTKPTLPFGVRVPARHAADPVIAEQRRTYRWWVSTAGGALVTAGFALSWILDRRLTTVVVLIALFSVIAPSYAHARARIQAVKRREDWYQGLRQGAVVDTSLRSRPERPPWIWAGVAVTPLLITVVAGIVRYPAMPATLTLHYNTSGAPDRAVAKSVVSAFGLVFVQTALTAGILLLVFFSFRFRPDLDPARPSASARQHRGFLLAMARALMLLVAFINVALLAGAWQTWSGTREFAILPVLAPLLAGLAVVLGFAIRTGQSGSRLHVDEDEHTDVVERDDDRYWRGLGMLYLNRDDPAVFVPKRFGIGWTINFGNPRGIAVLVAILATAIALPLLLR